MDHEKLRDTKPEHIRLVESRQSQGVIVQLEEDVVTSIGPIHVVIHGDRRNPAIVTFHDIGLTSKTCFQTFFNFPEMRRIMKHFCVFHVNALGQHEEAAALPMGYIYPTMDQMAMSLLQIIEHYGLKTFIGFGVGAGANILSRFALSRPERVDGLILVNGNASQAGWIEWAYQKWNAWYLKSNMMTAGVEEYLLWHWFGNKTVETNADLVNTYTHNMKAINAVNLGHFIASYIKRTDLGIWREMDPVKKPNVKNFTCPVMLVAGDNSPHLDDTVEMNGRLDPTNSSWVKFSCGGMVLEECPGNLSESIRLFVQGMGYVPSLRGSVDLNPAHLQAARVSTANELC